MWTVVRLQNRTTSRLRALAEKLNYQRDLLTMLNNSVNTVLLFDKIRDAFM